LKKTLLIIFSCFFTSPSFATSELYSGSEEIKEVLNQNIYEPNYFVLFLSLFLVIILIYLTGIVYNKLTKIKLTNNQDETNKIEIISTTSLGQGKNLHIIKINNEYSLIGATQNNINFLKEINTRKYNYTQGKNHDS